MSRKNAITATLAAIFTAVVVALVAAGVCTHEEPGLRRPSVTWRRAAFPLRVLSVDYATGEPRHDADVADIVATVDYRLDFDALRLVREEPADVLVVLDAPVQSGSEWDAPGGHFEAWGAGGHWTRCEVTIANVRGPNDLQWLTVYHEIGHCLGLAHDPSEVSIMRPVQQPTPPGTPPPWITDHDRDLLRAMYGPR